MTMMSFRLFLFFFFLMSFAASQERDSLETLIRKEKNAEKRADLMLELADYLSDVDTVEAIVYIKKAQKIIPKNNKVLQGKVYFTFGQQFFGVELKKAQKFYKRAINLLENQQTKDSYILMARAWHNYAAQEQYQDNSDIFISIILNKSIPLAAKAGRKDLEAQYLNDIGSEMYNRKLYEKSISYFDQSLKTIEKEPENYNVLERKIEFNVNAAQSYLYLNNSAKAKKYLQSAEAIIRRYPQNPLAVSFYLVNAKYFQLNGDFLRTLCGTSTKVWKHQQLRHKIILDLFTKKLSA